MSKKTINTVNEETMYLNPFYLKSLLTPIFSYNDSTDLLKNIEENLEIHTSISVGVNDNKNVSMSVTIKYYIPEQNTELTILLLKTDAEFVVDDIDSILTTDKNGFYRIPIDYIEVFTGILYSTIRGIIFAKTQGTLLSQFILPVKSASELVEPLLNSPNQET